MSATERGEPEVMPAFLSTEFATASPKAFGTLCSVPVGLKSES